MLSAIIIAFFSVIFLMVIHEFGHFIVAKKSGIEVEEFGVGYPPRIYGRKFGKTLYSINLIPFGAFVKIPGEIGGIEDYQSFSGLAMWKRVFIILGGVISFWIAAIIIFSVLFNIGVDVPVEDVENLTTPTKVQIVDVHSNSPAQTAGIKKGDIIKELSSQAFGTKEVVMIKDFQDFIELNKGQEVVISFQRGNQILQSSVIPRISPPDNEGSLGVQLTRTATVIEKYPWYQTPVRGLIFTGELTWKSLASLAGLVSDLVTGKGLPAQAEPAGPIGITVYIAKAAEMGVGFFLYFIGAISVLLAIFNLLPIPALDGGKLMFMAIEKIRSKPVSPKIEGIVTTSFFFVLIALSLFITIKFDIPKLSGFIMGSF